MKTVYRIITVAILLYPLVLILIPRMFGYYLYGPLNGGLVYFSWVVLLLLGGVSEIWKKNRKEAKIYLGILIVVAGWYMALDVRGQAYGNMRKVTPEEQLAQWRATEERFNLEPEPYECNITYYRSSPVGGSSGISILYIPAYGGGDL